MTTDTQQPTECPLCGHAKPEHQRACDECRSVLVSCCITETQALDDMRRITDHARRIRNWEAQ